MNSTLSASPTVASATGTAPRHDLYSQIHKALRALMFDTLERVGRMDVHDPADRGAALARVERLLAHLSNHLEHENGFVHTAIDARRPGGSAATAEAHLEHQNSMAALAGEVAELRNATPGRAPLLAQRLYRHLALFVAENLEHMQIEETVNNTLLWSLYSDAELHAIHGRLVAALDPVIMGEALDWLARASHAQELAALLGGMQAGMPPEPFRAVLAQVRAQLDDRRWAKLASALRLPAR